MFRFISPVCPDRHLEVAKILGKSLMLRFFNPSSVPMAVYSKMNLPYTQHHGDRIFFVVMEDLKKVLETLDEFKTVKTSKFQSKNTTVIKLCE